MNRDGFIKLYWPVLALFVFGIAFLGYTLDKSQYIPFILNNADHNLFASDIFVNSQSTFHSLFFPAVGYLLRYIDFNILFNVLYVLNMLTIALAIFHLSLLLFKDKVTAYLTVFLFLTVKSGISVSPIGINMGAFEAATLAHAFSIFAIFLFLKERYRIACLIIGLLFYIHAVEALSISAIFLFYFLIRMRSLPRRRIFESSFLLILPVLPMLFKLLSSNFFEMPSQAVISQWRQIIHFRSFFHIFPFSWGISDWFGYLGWFLWAFIVLRFLRPPEKHDHVMVFCGAIALMCLVGTLFVELIFTPLVIKMLFWRSTMFFVLFLVIYISRYLVKFPKDTLISRLLVAGTIAALFFSFQRLVVCFALLHLAYEVRNRKYLSNVLTAGGIAGILCFTAGSLFALEGNTMVLNKIFSFADLGLGNVILFYLLFAFLAYFLYLHVSERMKFSKRQLIALASFLIFLVALKGVLLKDIEAENYNKDWVEAQLWAKENTMPETVFVTPPYLKGFRTYSQRGLVAENKDGLLNMYNIKFALNWWQRMNDLGCRSFEFTSLDFVPECKQNYSVLDEKEVRRLGDKYGADYFVSERPSELDLKTVYKNNHFSIYSIRPLD